MTRRTKDAFLWITNILKRNEIPFQISGGTVARIYGPHRRLADIDIDMNQSQYRKILNDLKSYYIWAKTLQE